MEISVIIDRNAVLSVVTYSTAYTGSKFVGDDAAYDRINTKDADHDKLLQMWDESAADLAETFRGVLKSQELIPVVGNVSQEPWEIKLDVPSNFDSSSTDGIAKNLTSFFSNSILGKWFAYTNKQEAGAYADHAQTFLNAAHALTFERKKPTRRLIMDPDVQD